MTWRVCFLGAVLACCVVWISGCATTDLVTIHYRQDANLQEFDIPAACTAAIAANGGSNIVTSRFSAIYEITSIANTDQKPLTFTLQVNKLYVGVGGQQYFPDWGDNCLQTAQDTIVAPGSTAGYIGRILVNVKSAWGSAGDHNSEFSLFYAGPNGQPVVFVRETGIRPSAYGFSGQPAGLPIFETYATDPIMGSILQCAAQLNPPSGCQTE